MKIAVKIGLAFLAIAIVINAVTAYIFYSTAKKAMEEDIRDHLTTIIESRKKHLETYLAMLKLSVEQLSKSVVLENFLHADKTTGAQRERAFDAAMRRLRRTREVNPFVYEFLLLNSSGKITASSIEKDIGLDMSGDAIYLGGQKSAYIKDAYLSTTLKTPAMAVSAPITDNGTNEVIGVIAARTLLDSLYAILTDRSGLGDTGEIYLVNKYGFMISPSRFIKETFLKQKININKLKSLTHPCLLEGRPIVYKDYRGISVLGIHEYIPQMQWLIFAEIDASEVFAPLAEMRRLFFIILLLSILASLLLGRAVAELITRPIHTLHKGTEIIGAGNLDYKVGTPAKDEIGELSRAFDEMSEHLKTTTTSVDKLNKEIEERKRVEAELERLAAIVESSEDAIISRDIEGNVVSWNKGAQRLYGYAFEEIALVAGQSAFVPPECEKEIPELIEKIRRGEKAEHFETFRIAKGGRKLYVSVTPSVILDDSGRIIGVSTISRDITKEKEAERRIAEALAEWQRTFNSISDMIFIVDQNFTIQKVNDSCCKMLHRKCDDLIGKKCYQIMHNLDHPWPGCPHKAVLSSRLPASQEVDDPNIGIPLAVSVFPIINESGEMIGSVHVARDISERKKVEKALRDAAEIKTNFTSVVSHELRTPLAAIKEGIAIVLDGTFGPLNNDQTDSLGIAKRNVDRLARLIDDILDFQKLESGKMEFKITPNDINETAKEVRQTMLSIAEQKGLDIILQLQEDLPQIKFDHDRIIQVITNLVNNAIKFTQKGAITIVTGKQDNLIKVSVKDTGIGIKEDELSLLFERFRQLDTGMGRKTGGTGLGLSICKDIIEKHDGKIWVESKPGQGSVFSFTLPPA